MHAYQGVEFPLLAHAEEQQEKSSLLYENIPVNYKHSTEQGLFNSYYCQPNQESRHVFP